MLLWSIGMWIIGTLAGAALIVLALVDGFESILQPRRVTHRYRFTRAFYRGTWAAWRAVAVRIGRGKRREAFLGVFGPLSLLALIAAWVCGLIVGFGLVHWSLKTMAGRAAADNVAFTFRTYLYLSGTTFFTLGYGDVTPVTAIGRALAVGESGLGFGFLAVIVSYLPVLYQAFSRREAVISLMDARAGSPPSAAAFILRAARSANMSPAVEHVLVEWERWAAELLESHLSFPVLSFYRSQHDNQSWLAALTTILDACALLLVSVRRADAYQAQLTFAMARHAAVDLALVLHTEPVAPATDRLPADQWERLRQSLRDAGLDLHDGAAAAAAATKLAELRGMYEPFVSALALRFLMALPPIIPDDLDAADNWQRSAWMRRTPGIGSLPAAPDADEHF